MAQSETIQRILDAAEELFSQSGFTETSLRSITSKANVNLAAVNYHFGSKKALIQAVFARYLTPFTLKLDHSLEIQLADNKKQQLTIDQLLKILVLTFVTTVKRNRTTHIFMRLLGLAYTESQGHLRKFLQQEYQSTYRRFMRLVREATPELTNIERFWRIHFTLGATIFTFSGVRVLRAMESDDYGTSTDVIDIVKMLVPYLAAGLNTKSEHFDFNISSITDKD